VRRLYTLLVYLLVPLVLVRLAWRALRAPAYWRGWGERFGFGGELDGDAPTLWVHAVSVGEVQAALPLLRAIRIRHPGARLLVTTTTPTGALQVRSALREDPDFVHRYVPYDLPGAVRRFLARARPRLLVVMETELWPNLIHYTRAAGIPAILANARLSESSARGYGRVGPLARQTLRGFCAIAAQHPADAERLIALGAPKERVRVTGNVKADVRLSASLREQAAALRHAWGNNRPVWIAASTHEGEEEQVLDAFERIREALPEALLVLVPRHPERFARVARLCRRRGLTTVQRSTRRVAEPSTEVFLGDTMGELPLLYAAADVAFVGGSLVRVGGHNVLEPAALGLPVVVGPHTFNFAEVTRMLLDRGAARCIGSSAELADCVLEWLGDASRRHAVGERGREVVEGSRGALEALVALVEAHWAEPSRRAA
jgi:3-deoxy-D-manno-octulosonic-acid transferase